MHVCLHVPKIVSLAVKSDPNWLLLQVELGPQKFMSWGPNFQYIGMWLYL